MKTLLRIFSIALVSGVALVSCGKITPTGGNEQGGDTPGTETGGGDEPGGNTDPDVPTRVLSVSFDTEATRTYLGDNGYPYFEKNDVILVATTEGEAQTEKCTVYYRNGVAMIETSLPGVLRAVYPAAAADLKNGRIVGVKVPAVQTGLFKDANICMVDVIPVNATKVTFLNQTALIAIKVPENTDYIEVTSLCEIDDVQTINSNPNPDYGYRTSTQKSINNYGDDPYTIIVKNSNQTFGMNSTSSTSDYQKQTYYVSVLTDDTKVNNVRLIDLNFDIYSQPSTDGYSYDNNIVGEGNKLRKMGGFSPELVWRYMPEKTLPVSTSVSVYAEKSSIYILPESSLHQYVKVGDCKWATMNIGATSPEDPGDLFFWAGLDGHRYDNSLAGNWTNFSLDTRTFDYYSCPEDGFMANNAPHYDGTGYDKYNDSDSQVTLCLWEDAAFVHWGGAWSMMPADSPAFEMLDAGTHENGGYSFKGVFLPYNCYGFGDQTYSFNVVRLWSSSVDSNADKAKYFKLYSGFQADYISIESEDRYFGHSIRPVSGVSSAPDEPDDDGLILEIDQYTNGWGTSN